MILFLAGLMAIPGHLYEAAEVDGAHRPLDKFLTVTWPMLGPDHALRDRDHRDPLLPRLRIGGRASPRAGPATPRRFCSSPCIARASSISAPVTGAALTIVFLAFILILTLIQIRVIDRRVHYA